MNNNTHTQLQGKVFDFALVELIRQHRESFQPLWSQDSWAKFLIWMTLNCGLSGERENLELFANALGPRLTSRMRRVFFERTLEDMQMHVMADPAEKMILVMPIGPGHSVDQDNASKALLRVGLLEMIIPDRKSWETLEEIVAIPWNSEKQIH